MFFEFFLNLIIENREKIFVMFFIVVKVIFKMLK